MTTNKITESQMEYTKGKIWTKIKNSVCANFAHTVEDGKEYQTKCYSLEEIHDTLLPKLMSGEVRVN